MIIKKGLFAAGVLAGLTACRPQDKSQPVAADTTNNRQAVQQRIGKLNLQFERVIQPDSSDYLLLPLTFSEPPDEEGFIDERSYKKQESDHYWNVAFYNTRTGNHHLLDENRKMLIHQIAVNDSEENDFGNKRADATYPKHIFYQVITADYNGDRRFSTEDLTYLFVSDPAGRAFRQLSPPGYDLISWEPVRGTHKILMLVHKDTNNNRKRDEADEKPAFLADLDRPEPARELFTAPEKTHLKELYDRDWQRIR
jgi:hypothetical protein